MRPIDADALDSVVLRMNTEGAQITRGEYKLINCVIFEFPTIDAVPVVRCRDCIFHKEKRCTVWRERAVIVECYTDDDGYCYKGMRKEE